MNRVSGSNGFTLVELMMALLIGGIVMGAVFTSFNSQHSTYLAQEQAVQVQQSTRAAMDLMAREIRMAGFDPWETAGATITAADAGTLTFTMDGMNGAPDGNSTGDDENISYSLQAIAGGGQRLRRQKLNGGANDEVAPLIDGLEFYYTMATGPSPTLTPGTLADIRAVQVTILARAATSDPSYTVNTSYTTPGGQVWAFNDSSRRRLLTRLIQCRNMGM